MVISENNGMISDLNKLLHQDLQIPMKTDDKKLSSEKIQTVFNLIKVKAPGKFQNILNFLEAEKNKPRDQTFIIKF